MIATPIIAGLFYRVRGCGIDREVFASNGMTAIREALRHG